MYNKTENPSSDYEITINKLSIQIEELFSKIHFYQALVAEKEIQIKQLIKENQNLIAKVQKLTQQSTTSLEPSQDSYTPPTLPSIDQSFTPPTPPPIDQSFTPPTPPPIDQSFTPPTPPPIPLKEPEISFSLSEDPRINKRVCPNCGAMGFAIREVDDKSKVISYSPRRMYAKKRSCTKCRYEW